MGLPSPVIVIPGITATYLRDEYPLPPEQVWTVLTKKFERVTQHPDDARYEAAEPARVVPDQIYEVAYRELIQELRYNLSDDRDRPVPVYPFGYDWRQPLGLTEMRLKAFVDEVIDRTLLMRHYDKDAWSDAPTVNLIGHSMGGLIAAGYLQRFGKQSRVGKVVSLASPFRGSYEAVLKMTTGTAAIGGVEPASREREAARLTPALYHLLPSFPGAVNAPGLPDSLFNPDLWQPSVLATITDFIKNYGLPDAKKGNAATRAKTLFAAMLNEAKSHRDRLEKLSLTGAGLTNDDWLCVVGVGSETRVKLAVTKSERFGPQFDLSSSGRASAWPKNPASTDTGDGTVPYLGAECAFVPKEKIVCVSTDDFGYWEVQDKLTASVAGFHGILPNMDMLHRMIVRFFTGAKDQRKNTWGRPAPGVAAKDWNPPLRLDPA